MNSRRELLEYGQFSRSKLIKGLKLIIKQSILISSIIVCIKYRMDFQQDNRSSAVSNIEADSTVRRELIPFQIQIGRSNKKLPAPSSNEEIDTNFKIQLRNVIIVSSCLFYFGFNRAMVASTINSQTTKEFQKLFNFQGNVVLTKAFLSIISPLGALFGSIFTSFLIKYQSPKDILFTVAMCALIFTFVTLYTEIIVLFIFRFGIGWCVGTFVAIIPSFIKETSSKNYAPYFGTAPIINQSLGGLFSFIFGFILYQSFETVRETWIILGAINVVPLIVVIVCLKTNVIYESPIFYLKNGYVDEAKQIFEQMYKPEYIKAIVEEKQLQITRFYFKEIKSMYSRKVHKFLRRKDILISLHLPILRKMTGILVILLSSGSMLKTINPKFERVAPILINLTFFISCFLSNLILKYLTRRAAFQFGTISICICNIIISLGYYFEIFAVVILVFKVILLIMYGLTLGPLVWPYLPQVVPARIIPLAQSMNWLIDVVTLSLPGVIIANHGNPWPLFFVFFLWDFFSIFINYFLIVQTKAKTVEEIINDLDSKKQ